jgi:signal peptidase I
MDDITPTPTAPDPSLQPTPVTPPAPPEAPTAVTGSMVAEAAPTQVNNNIPAAPVVTPPAKAPKEAKGGKLKSILSTVAILLIAPLLALTITAFIFQSYEVDGPSMQSTLQDHDRLIIWKVSRTWARLTHHDYVPKRGDVIVFIKRGLYEDNGDKEKQLIKRVIALPGERVTVKEGKVMVYNTQHPDGFDPDTTLPYGGVIKDTDGNVDVTVPAGEVFVCGDNRSNSLDSRYFGPIPTHDIVGKLAARILPIGEAEKF